MPLTPEGRSLRGRVAILARRRGPDAPEVLEGRRVLKAAAAERYIRELVAEAPPLTESQRARLAVLLLSPPPDGGGSA